MEDFTKEGKRKQDMTDIRIILDLCGGTGSWSKPYQEAGYDVRIITLPDYDVRTYIHLTMFTGSLQHHHVQNFHF